MPTPRHNTLRSFTPDPTSTEENVPSACNNTEQSSSSLDEFVTQHTKKTKRHKAGWIFYHLFHVSYHNHLYNHKHTTKPNLFLSNSWNKQ